MESNTRTPRSRLGTFSFVQSLFAVLLFVLAMSGAGSSCECESSGCDCISPMLSYTSWERIGNGENCHFDKSSFHCTEDDVSPDYWQYTVQPRLVDFVQHPVGAVTSDAYVLLQCGISSPLVTCSDAFQPTIHWELNGAVISRSSNFSVEENATSSQLTVDMNLGSEVEGIYTCFVDDHYFSLQSLPAQIQKPSHVNWTEEVYDAPIMVTEIEGVIYHLLSVQEGGTAVLECTGTGLTGHQIVSWLDDDRYYINPDSCQCYLPNENLVIRNFSLPTSTATSTVDSTTSIVDSATSIVDSATSTVDQVQYKCVVNEEGQPPYSKVYLLQAKPVSSSDPLYPTFVASPRSQEIAAGEDLILYCIAIGELPISYSWNREPPSSEGFNDTGVLIIQNSSLEDTGDYTCTVSNRYNRSFSTAHVVVRGPPEVNIVPHPMLSLSPDGDILLPPANTSYNLSLKCVVSSNSPSLQLTWLFRGRPVPATEHYFTSGDLLKITSPDIYDATGSVQCLAEDIGGRGSAAIRIVQEAKPNPPHQISVTTLNANNYTYLVEWTPPVASSWSVLNNINYQVQITYSAQQDALESCSVFPEIRDHSVIFDAKNNKGLPDNVMCLDQYKCGNDLLAILNVSVVAFYPDTPLVTSDGTSTCFSVSEELDSTLVLEDMREKFTPVLSEAPHYITPHYNVTLSWLSLGESYLANSAYCGLDFLYRNHYFLCWSCAGLDLTMRNSCFPYKSKYLEPSGECLPTSRTIQANCMSSCQWKVGISPVNLNVDADKICDDAIHWTDVMTFTTAALVPTVEGHLDGLRWSDENGQSFTIDVTLPSDNITCSPSNIVVTYEYDSKTQLSQTQSFKAGESHYKVHVEFCYVPYSVSFVYNNSAGKSPTSNTNQLPFPSAEKAAVLSNFNLSSDPKDPTELTLTWKSSQGSNCLYKSPFFTVRVYLSLAATNHSNCTAASFNDSIDVTDYQSPSLVFHNKEYYVAYCILTSYWLALTDDDADISPYNESVYVAVESSKPPSSSSHDGESASTAPDSGSDTPTSSSYVLPVVVGVLGIFFIFMIIITVVVFTLVCKMHRKRNVNDTELEEVRRLVPEGAEERRNIVCKDLETDDIHSEHTQYDTLIMEGYLNDVMSHGTHAYMATIVEEMDVDDAGDKIPQPVRPVTPPRAEALLPRPAPHCTDKSPSKLVSSIQQQAKALPTDSGTESPYIQPHLMETLRPGQPYPQENLIELDDMTLHRDDPSIQSSNLIHMSDYVGEANALLRFSPTCTSPLSSTSTAAHGQQSRQPSLTVTNGSPFAYQKVGEAVSYGNAQMASSVSGQGLPALQSHLSGNHARSVHVALSQRLPTMEAPAPPSRGRHVAMQSRHVISACDGNILGDGYVEENLPRVHQRDQPGKPRSYRIGSPVGSADWLQQELSYASPGEPGFVFNSCDLSSPLPPKNPFQGGATVSDLPQTSLTRPSSRLSTDSGMTILSNSSSEQSVFTDMSEQQSVLARNVWLSRRHSSGVSSMPLSVPATPDTGQPSFQFPEMEAQLSHAGSQSSLPFTGTTRTRTAVAGSEYISDPSQPFMHTPKRVVQPTAGGRALHHHPSDLGNRSLHQISQGNSLSSPNRPLPSSTVPPHVPDVVMQQKKFPGRWVGHLTSSPMKSMHSTPNKPPDIPKLNYGTTDYVSNTLDRLPAHTVCCSSVGHRQGHTTLTRTYPSAAMQQIPSLLPHCRDTHQQTLHIGATETDKLVPRSEWVQSGSQDLRTLKSEPVLEETCACSDGSVQSRTSSINSESYSLGSLSPSLEELNALNNDPAPEVLRRSDTGRAKAPLSNYTNTNGIEIDGVVFNLQEAFS